MAVFSDKKAGEYIATGEVGKKPKIFVWDTASLQPKFKLQGKLVHGIQCLAFSPSGRKLAAVDNHPDHNIAIYDMKTGLLESFSKGGNILIAGIVFKDETNFATCGVRHMKFWTIGKTLKSKNAVWGKANRDHNSVLCVAVNTYDSNSYLGGNAKGCLVIYDTANKMAEKKDNPMKLHSSAIDTVRVVDSCVFTGGRDMMVTVLDALNYELKYKVNLDNKLISMRGEPRAIDVRPSGSKPHLVVGTFGCEIIEASIQVLKANDGKANPDSWKVITRGHFQPNKNDTNVVWGLAQQPGKDKFWTVGEDGTLRLWNSKEHKQIYIKDLNMHEKEVDGELKPRPKNPKTKGLNEESQATCIDVDVNCRYIAVGFKSGHVRVFLQANNDFPLKVKLAKESKSIELVRFSPDGKFLIVSSHANTLSKYNIEAKTDIGGSKTKIEINKLVTHLDFSDKGDWLRLNTNDYELLYHPLSQRA